VDGSELDHEEMAIELCSGFTPLDQAALAALEPDGLVAQYEARLALFEYVDAMWDQAKAEGTTQPTTPATAQLPR